MCIRDRFNTVELNASYYRWPRDATFASWRRRLPPWFRMTVKAPRGLTHSRRLYAPEEWTARIRRSLALLDDRLVAAGHRPVMIDLGGGVPMSYLDDGSQWAAFWSAMREPHAPEALTWRDRPLDVVYPYFQSPVRGEWLAGVLDATVPGVGQTAACALRTRGLALQLEPGRCLLYTSRTPATGPSTKRS